MQKKIGAFLIAALLGSSSIASVAIAANAPRYTVTRLTGLGGTSSQGSSINAFGLIAGFSNTDGANTHATVWWFGAMRDLGTLGGANSAVLWPVKNVFGVVSGIAQTDTDQPNQIDEDLSCAPFIGEDGHTCRGFVWAFGKMRALPPLPGGYNSFATGTNNRLQTVGWAENGVHDPNCNADPNNGLVQVLQFLPVFWEPGRHRPHALPLLPGDDSGAATAINDRGEIVGISGTCDQAVGRDTAKHMVMWKHGHAINLGNIGGENWNTPMAINRWGDVIGFADSAPGDAVVLHAFFRGRDGGPPIDLGTLGGNTKSQALGINDRGQVVGLSYGGSGGTRGFLYEDNEMFDLNDPEVTPGYSGVIIDAQDINDLGQITGQACTADGDCYAFRADPIPDYHGRRQHKH